MTPGNAVRKKAHAAIHTDRTHDKHWCNLPDGQHSPACHWLVDVWLAGHAEGRAEGLEWAVSKYCRNKHDAECYNHETCPCERCCHYRPIHRELARLRGGK